MKNHIRDSRGRRCFTPAREIEAPIPGVSLTEKLIVSNSPSVITITVLPDQNDPASIADLARAVNPDPHGYAVG